MIAANYKTLMFCIGRYFITPYKVINESFDYQKLKMASVKNPHYTSTLNSKAICKYIIQAKCDKIKIQE